MPSYCLYSLRQKMDRTSPKSRRVNGTRNIILHRLTKHFWSLTFRNVRESKLKTKVFFLFFSRENEVAHIKIIRLYYAIRKSNNFSAGKVCGFQSENVLTIFFLFLYFCD